ncbi:hypothetical protein [Undibacterium pigrum]|uniref:Uncharacterized protein n=1 Tax=Undibacterium pigrum TaxID=401470 RepID=A0A318IJG0_9BURK|nr:hypothetical protein [Undibacterium pigrum]PXX34903.1 hypothetical protein DFR42_1256 [Undibacterium pigrum]
MNTSTVIDIAIGLVLVYFLLSMVCSALNELLAQLLASRAKYLKKGLTILLTDPEKLKKFYEHPLIASLGEPVAASTSRLFFGDIKPMAGKNLHPSYIPSKAFAQALIDMVVQANLPGPNKKPHTFDNVRQAVVEITDDDELRTALLSCLDSAQYDLEQAKKNMEEWFDNTMDRVSGWYKRNTQQVLIIFALLIATFFNINTLTIVDRLWESPQLRNDVANLASSVSVSFEKKKREKNDACLIEKKNNPDLETCPDTEKKYNTEDFKTWNETIEKLEKNNLPFGWSNVKECKEASKNCFCCIVKNLKWSDFFGILFTTISVSFGAPFWFELLNKLLNLRTTGAKPEKNKSNQ